MSLMSFDPSRPPVPDFNGVFNHEYALQLNIKDNVINSVSLCCQCKKNFPRSELKACSKCRSMHYCSKECQKIAWPKHKAQCIPEASGHSKLMRAFVANPLLLSFLHVAIIMDMELHKKPNTGPFSVIVHFHVLPTANKLLAMIGDPEADYKSKDGIKGMLQIGVVKTDPNPASLAPSRLAIWRRMREHVDAAGHASDPIAWINLALDSKSATTTVVPSQIPPHCFDAARANKPFSYICPRTGVRRSVPMSTEGCIRYINWYIHADDANHFKLRSNLTNFDINIIKRARRLFINNRKPKDGLPQPQKEDLAVQSLFYRITESEDPLYADHVNCLDL